VSSREKLVKGAGIIFASSVISSFFGYLFRLYLARTSSINDYGLFYAAFALVTTVVPFKDFGMSLAVARFIPEYLAKKSESKIINAMALLTLFQTTIYGIALSIVVMLNLTPNSPFQSSREFYSLIVILSIAFFFSTFGSMFNAVFLGYKRYDYLAITNTLFSLALLIALIAVNLLNSSILGAGYAYLAAYIFSTVFGLTFFLKTVPQIKGHIFKFDIVQFKTLFGFGFLTFLSITIKNFAINSGTIFLSIIGSLQSVAMLNVAYPTANFLKFLMKPLSTVILPISSESYSNNSSNVGIINDVYRYKFVFFLPIIYVLAAFSEEIITFFYGKNFSAASELMLPLLYAYFFLALIEFNQGILMGHDKSIQSTLVFVVVGISVLIGNLLLIPRYGQWGAAIGFLIGIIIGFMASLYYINLEKIRLGFVLFAHMLIFLFMNISITLVIIQLKLTITGKLWIVAISIGLFLQIIYAYLARMFTIEEIKKIIVFTTKTRHKNAKKNC